MMPPQRSRSLVIAGAVLALVFVAGVAAGMIADRLSGGTPVLRTRVVQDMSGVLDKLGLSAEQRSQADAIIKRSGPRTREAMLEIADRLRAVSDSVDQELRAILTTGQRARLDSLRREPVFMLKRMTPGSATVDTVFPGRRDNAKRP